MGPMPLALADGADTFLTIKPPVVLAVLATMLRLGAPVKLQLLLKQWWVSLRQLSSLPAAAATASHSEVVSPLCPPPSHDAPPSHERSREEGALVPPATTSVPLSSAHASSPSLLHKPRPRAFDLQSFPSGPHGQPDQQLLLRQIQDSRTLPDLEFVVLRYAASMDALNVSSAIAKLPHMQVAKASPRNRRRVAAIVHQLLPRFRSCLSEYGPRSISSCIWALAKLDVKPGDACLDQMLAELCAQQGRKMLLVSGVCTCTKQTPSATAIS